MRFSYKILILILLYLSSVNLFCSEIPADVRDVLQVVFKNFHQIKTIQGKVKRNTSVDKSQEESEGFFFQEVPHKVYLEYTSEPRQKIVSDGKTLWIYSLEKKEVILLDNLTPEELSTMQRFDFYYLLDEVAASSAYTMKVFSRDNDEVVLAAIPKNPNPYLSQMLIKVALDKGIILAYETFAANNTLTNQIILENYRKYNEFYYPQKVIVKSIVAPEQMLIQTAELYRLEFNQTLADSHFQFAMPSGVKVINRTALQELLKKSGNP